MRLDEWVIHVYFCLKMMYATFLKIWNFLAMSSSHMFYQQCLCKNIVFHDVSDWENCVWNKVNQGHEKVSCVKQGYEVIDFLS